MKSNGQQIVEASSSVLLPSQMTEWFTSSWYTKIYYRHHSQAGSISCDFNIFQLNIWKSWETCIGSTEVLFMGLRSMSSGMGGAGILPEKTQNTENDIRWFCQGIVFWIRGINWKTIWKHISNVTLICHPQFFVNRKKNSFAFHFTPKAFFFGGGSVKPRDFCGVSREFLKDSSVWIPRYARRSWSRWSKHLQYW